MFGSSGWMRPSFRTSAGEPDAEMQVRSAELRHRHKQPVDRQTRGSRRLARGRLLCRRETHGTGLSSVSSTTCWTLIDVGGVLGLEIVERLRGTREITQPIAAFRTKHAHGAVKPCRRWTSASPPSAGSRRRNRARDAARSCPRARRRRRGCGCRGSCALPRAARASNGKKPVSPFKTSLTPSGPVVRAAVPGNEEAPVHGGAVRQRQRRLYARLFDAVSGECSEETGEEPAMAPATFANRLPRGALATCTPLRGFTAEKLGISQIGGVRDVPTSHTPHRCVSAMASAARRWRRNHVEV